MRYVLLLVGMAFLPCGGCKSVAESLFDSIVDSVLGDSNEIEPKVLERKGIEPGSKQHKQWMAEEEFQREFRQDFE